MKNKQYKKRNMYMLSHIEPWLLARIRLYAKGTDTPIYKVFEHLLVRGLKSESGKVSCPESDNSVDIYILTKKKQEKNV